MSSRTLIVNRVAIMIAFVAGLALSIPSSLFFNADRIAFESGATKIVGCLLMLYAFISLLFLPIPTLSEKAVAQWRHSVALYIDILVAIAIPGTLATSLAALRESILTYRMTFSVNRTLTSGDSEC